ncbi:hypothetical protein ACFSUP_04265 [Gracilibacillus thailandensis]|uniref:hypothetical protein n=1 Tax=Gracilibacillus thailandensis TaxID=563735 RepID=UPI00363DE975
MASELGGNARSWYWDAGTMLAAILGIAIGLRNIPAVVEGIWFVQVVPALVLGGFAGLAVDGVRVAVAPERSERAFVKVAGMMLMVIVVSLVHKVLEVVKEVNGGWQKK